jgi:hypothetical protein
MASELTKLKRQSLESSDRCIGVAADCDDASVKVFSEDMVAAKIIRAKPHVEIR